MAGFTRRQFLVGAGSLAGVQLLAPIVTRSGGAVGAADIDPATDSRRRLVVIFLPGGNDGLNTVIPRADVAGAPRRSVYQKVRPNIGYSAGSTKALDRPADHAHELGLNSKLDTLYRLYKDDRVAIVQGVDYPNHNYSHFASQTIWQSGEPDRGPDSGWLGRHLDRAGIAPGELRAVGIGTALPLMLTGARQQGSEIQSLPATHFVDGSSAAAAARHAALTRFATHPADQPVRRLAGQRALEAVTLSGDLAAVPPPKTTTGLAAGLLTARRLLESRLGVEAVFVPQQANYDTHVTQKSQHEKVLNELDNALEAFYFGTLGGQSTGDRAMAAGLASRTLVLIISEFGRRIGENGGAGTDHGAAAPVFLIGPPPGTSTPTLQPGLHGDHPDMGTTTLPADNLLRTTDMRAVYQAVLQGWLGDPDPLYNGVGALPGLFA
ncbi:MAG: DUF1501 domain-containing protein [Acidimicrobiia bacterium]|nr:DUF1501 domain-containing protein [Acidimicrobiia bacterium]